MLETQCFEFKFIMKHTFLKLGKLMLSIYIYNYFLRVFFLLFALITSTVDFTES